LAQRLARRGVTCSSGALAAALAQQTAAACVPPALLTGTVQAATLLAAGQTAALLSARVLTLMEGVVQTMLLAKLKNAAALLLAVGLLVVGAGVLRHPALGNSPGPGEVDAGPQAAGAVPEKQNVREARRQVHPLDSKEVWTLDFRFHDPRLLAVDAPGKGKAAVWYLGFEVVNSTGQPRTFLPGFTLQSEETPDLPDQLWPQAVKAIAHVEDPAGMLALKDTATIAREPIAPSPPNAIRRGVHGVALWDQVRPACQRFSIFVTGLSNGWSTDDRQVLRHKTLQLNFKRVDDRMVLASPPQWLYRPTRLVVEDKNRTGPPQVVGNKDWLRQAASDNEPPAKESPPA